MPDPARCPRCGYVLPDCACVAGVRRYIDHHGRGVTLGQIAADTGLTVQQVARALDELQADYAALQRSENAA